MAAVGLRFAPAYDSGALNPGCMPLFVALIAALVLGEKLSTAQKLGLLLISAGALITVGWHAAGWSPARSFGDVLFLFAAFLTACFTVVMRQAKLDPLHVAALVSTGSLVIYLPIYLAWYGTRLAQLMLAEIAIQAIAPATMPAAAPSLGIRMLMASARSTPGRPSDLRALGERASIRWFYGLRGLVPHRGSLSCGSVNTTTCSMVVGRGPPDVVIWSWYRIPDSL